MIVINDVKPTVANDTRWHDRSCQGRTSNRRARSVSLPGDLVVPAIYTTSSEVRCVAPPHEAAVVALEVTCNGKDYSHTGISITFSDTPSVRDP